MIDRWRCHTCGVVKLKAEFAWRNKAGYSPTTCADCRLVTPRLTKGERTRQRFDEKQEIHAANRAARY